MAPEERDRSFDQALARHLRFAAPSSAGADAPVGSASPSSACPDAETLAAYHERSLLPEELHACKEHIVGCKQCRMILAHLEETDEIPLQASEEEKMFAGSELGSVAAAPSRAAAPIPAVTGPLEQKSGADASPAARTRHLRLLHGTRWRWLAPAGAIAAGLLVWISLHENRPAFPTASEETKMAKNLPATTPPLPAPPVLVTPRLSDSVTTVQPAPNGVAVSNGRAESHGLQQRQKHAFTPATQAPPLGAYADKESDLRKDADREKGDIFRRAETQGDLDAKIVAGAVEQKVELQAQAPGQSRTESPERVPAHEQTANNQIQNQSNANSSTIAGPAQLGQATAAKRMKAAPHAPAPPAVAAGVTRNYQSSQALELASTFDARLIAAPGSAVIWRTGQGGLIEISDDQGASWSRQATGVVVDLLTGSAVSDKICWVAGRAGTVLLTIDGGAHWKILTAPSNEDLGPIRATDGIHAKIWNIQMNKAFETNDGGVTWKRTANP